MKNIKKILLMLCVILFPICAHADGITINKKNLNIDKDGSTTFIVTATDATARLDLIVNNTNIKLSSTSSDFYEKNGSYYIWLDAVEKEKGNVETMIITIKGLKEGTSNIRIAAVQNESGVYDFNGDAISFDETINVTVNPLKSSNANLKDIKIDGTTINDFSSSKTTYNITTEKNEILISSTSEDSKAIVSLKDGKHTLKYGENKFTIKVTAENGITKNYVLNITRKDNRSSNNYLSKLTISSGTLSFNKNTTNYNVVVKDDVKNIAIIAEAADDKSTVTGIGTFTLKDKNTFNIVVTAENGNARKYTIIVKKEKGSIEQPKEEITKNEEPIENPKNEEPNKEETSSKETPQNNKVTITYNSNGGVMCEPINKSVVKGTKIGDLCITTRNKYKFKGWYTKKSGGKEITADSIIDKDFTLYAQWDKIISNDSNQSNANLLISLVSIFAVIIMLIITIIVKKRK